MNWIELHTDTVCSHQLSFLTGEKIVLLSARNGCAAVACTDRNSILSYLPMEREAERTGIRLIYGVTLDCADLDDRYAMTLLAKNETGRRNIFALMRLLEENRLPCGHCVTRQQIEMHREGLLLGASAVDGQLIRAIQLRRGTRRLQRIAAGYDYLEVPLEPYDTTAWLLQLAGEIPIPLCAVQSARLSPDAPDTECHAFRALCYDTGSNEQPARYLSPRKLAEQFRARFILPGEQQGLEKALTRGQEQILEQIEPMEPLGHLLNQNAAAAEQTRQKCLRAQAEEALLRKYGAHPQPAIARRLQWELERIEHLNMAGQILLMEQSVKAVHEAGGRASIAGTWNSSFLLYLLEITNLNPLPAELDPAGLDLCPVSLLEAEKPLLSADIRLSERFIPLVKEKVAEQYGRKLLQIGCTTREPKPEAELHALIEQYLEACCPKETAEMLRKDGSFYYTVNHYSDRLERDTSVAALQLLPETADPSALPVALDSPEGILKMETIGPHWLYHIPCVLLLDSPAQSALERCAHSTGVEVQKVPLDDKAIYAALGQAYHSGDTQSPVAAACKLLGSGVSPFSSEIFDAVGFSDLHELIRFMSLVHGSGLWQDNQQTLLQSGVLSPAQLITCREDIYRYLLERGASAVEARAFMESVRCGKLARDKHFASQTGFLQTCRIDDWFIPVCKKIQYLFPEDHSAEYAASLVRLVWYVLHDPNTAAILADEAGK